MGRAPCCSKVGLHRGPWTAKEDALLTDFIQTHGEGNWRSLPKRAGLLRCGKSCRLGWMNYLRPDIKRGNIDEDEEDLIIRLHSLLGNRWSLIAGRLPGRTDNEIKNYWNSHLVKKLKSQGIQVIEGTQKKNTEKKKKNKCKNKKSVIMEEEVQRTQIHAPKPTRLRPSTTTSPNIAMDPCGSSKGPSTMTSPNISMDPCGSSKGDDDICWNDFNQEVSLVFNSEFDNEDRLLEGVYQEYSQLLFSDDGYEFPPYVESYIFPTMSI